MSGAKSTEAFRRGFVVDCSHCMQGVAEGWFEVDQSDNNCSTGGERW